MAASLVHIHLVQHRAQQLGGIPVPAPALALLLSGPPGVGRSRRSRGRQLAQAPAPPAPPLLVASLQVMGSNTNGMSLGTAGSQLLAHPAVQS